MTLASDQNKDPEKLSAASRRMMELRDVVFAEWEKRVRASVKQAGVLTHPILMNTLPTFYDNIAELLTPEYPRSNAVAGTSIATEHGGERARLTNYDPKAVIAEYQTLRWTIFDILKQDGFQLTDDESRAINASLDSAIREAVTAFALVISALREQFTASLTHDLRNPLASAHMAAELIARTTDSPEIKALAERIISNHGRMDKMIQYLLDSMVLQGGGRPLLDLFIFDILEVVNEVSDQAKLTHGSRFKVIGNSVKGFWNRDAMKRALENLVGNAVKYSDPETPISIDIETMHERLLLSVHNTGNPIPPEEMEDIFQIFQRAKAAKITGTQGWGIGLPYVRSVAESHGGSIGVDSSLERGTTFYIDVPLDARPFQNVPAFTLTG